MEPPELAIDACCLLNLLATAREVDIAAALNVVLVTTPKARAEVLHLAGPHDEEGQPTRIPADASALERAGRLIVRALDPAATEAFVRAAERLRDSDASVVALAAWQQLPLASDDGKLRSLVQAAFPDVRLRSTLDLVRMAAEQRGWNTGELGVMARGLRIRGSFLPPRKDPNREWYAELLKPWTSA